MNIAAPAFHSNAAQYTGELKLPFPVKEPIAAIGTDAKTVLATGVDMAAQAAPVIVGVGAISAFNHLTNGSSTDNPTSLPAQEVKVRDDQQRLLQEQQRLQLMQARQRSSGGPGMNMGPAPPTSATS